MKRESAPNRLRTSNDRAWFSFAAVRKATKKYNWVHDLFVWPSEPISYVIANCTPLPANAVTIAGALLGLAGTRLFALNHELAAALFYFLFFVLDCSDGALARLRQQTSRLGAMLDLVCDRLVLLVAASSRIFIHLEQHAAWSALLCAVYITVHEMTDWMWYRQSRAERIAARDHEPVIADPVFAKLQQLAAHALQSPSDKNMHWLPRVSRIESEIRPAPWVCNIFFLLGGCLLPQAAPLIYLLGSIGIIWFVYAEPMKHHARRWLSATR